MMRRSDFYLLLAGVYAAQSMAPLTAVIFAVVMMLIGFYFLLKGK